MILEVVAAVAGVGAVTGWIFAFRARGESNAARKEANTAIEAARGEVKEATDRARLEAAKADAERRGRELAESNHAANLVELKAERAIAEGLRGDVRALQQQRRQLYDRMRAAGVPVGDGLVDDELDRLYQNEGG